MRTSRAAFAITMVVLFIGGSRTPAEPPTLKEAFHGKFLVGAALGTHQVMGEEPGSLELVAKHFNAISPENLLKWQEVHPRLDQFNFEPADRYVDFGDKNRKFILGHNLVWHNQTPAWVFEDASGKPLDRVGLLERMKEHIQAVVGRYKGRIQSWDVVNEAVDDNG